MPFSIAAAGILLESTSQIRTSAAHDAVAGPTIAHKADAARQRCALSLGANSPSSKSGFQGRTADAVCCALAWILLYLEDAATVSSPRITHASQTYMQMQWLTSCIYNDESYVDA
jgi:hypothetical protein